MADPHHHQAAAAVGAGGGFSSSGNVNNMVMVGTMREYRKGNWTVPETMVLIEAKKKDDERRQMMKIRHPLQQYHHLSSQVAISGDNHNSSSSPSTSGTTTTGGSGGGGKQPTELRWKWVEDYCWKKGCFRSQNQCNDKWDNLMRDYKKVRDYQRKLVEKDEIDNSYWKMERNERKEKNLPTNMSPLIYEALVHVVEKESSMKSMNEVKEAAVAVTTTVSVSPVEYVCSSSSMVSCSYIGQSTISSTMMMISGSTTSSSCCTSGMMLGSTTTTTTATNKISPTSSIPLPPLIMPQPAAAAAAISTIPSSFPYIPVIFSSPTMATTTTTTALPPPSHPHLSPPPPPPPLDSDTITQTTQHHSESSPPTKRRKILFQSSSSSPTTTQPPISPKPTTNPNPTTHHETIPTTPPEIDIHQVEAAITKSATVIAEAIRTKQEVEERRHKEIVSLQERRLKIEEAKVEMNRQGITGLVQAINNLADSILNLVGKSSMGDNGQQEHPPSPPPPPQPH